MVVEVVTGTVVEVVDVVDGGGADVVTFSDVVVILGSVVLVSPEPEPAQEALASAKVTIRITGFILG